MSNHIDGGALCRVHISFSSSWHAPTIAVEITFFSEISERQSGSVCWNRCTHMYKVCSRPSQGHGTWFFVYSSERARTKLSFHPSQKVLLACVTFLHILKNGQKRVFGGFFLYSLLPDSDSTGKNLSKSAIVGQVQKKKFGNVKQCNWSFHNYAFLETSS